MDIEGRDLTISVSGCSQGRTDSNILLSNATREGVCCHPCWFLQLTLEEAEEKINTEGKPQMGEEDEDEESARNSRLGLNKRGGDEDDEEGPRGGDRDLDDLMILIKQRGIISPFSAMHAGSSLLARQPRGMAWTTRKAWQGIARKRAERHGIGLLEGMVLDYQTGMTKDMALNSTRRHEGMVLDYRTGMTKDMALNSTRRHGIGLSDRHEKRHGIELYQKAWYWTTGKVNRIDFVHSKSFLHCDIKPNNFLMGLGRGAYQSSHHTSITVVHYGLRTNLIMLIERESSMTSFFVKQSQVAALLLLLVVL
nr:hypothetical protein [Tanacetum cinerariifolium]